MKSITELHAHDTGWINVAKLQWEPGRPVRMKLQGELGFRAACSAQRLEDQMPYSREYILGQLSGAPGIWTNFPRFHGDIAGRWILAMSYAHAHSTTPPRHLAAAVNDVLALQNPDGSFGAVAFATQPLNMHKAYGNGWLLKALAQYALTFGARNAKDAAVRLGDFFDATFARWAADTHQETDTGSYAVSRSCYFHSLDGLVTLYRLTRNEKYLQFATRYLPLLTPRDQADHVHMYLTIRRGVLELAAITHDTAAIAALEHELQTVYELHVLETGGVPERFCHDARQRADAARIFADEACAAFDWTLLAVRLHELTGHTCWLDRAILCLENHLYYNQLFNGGFGDMRLGPDYPVHTKEAPWCCSLFGPFGLLAAGAGLVQLRGDTLYINHLVSGEFAFDDGTLITTRKDDERREFVIRIVHAGAARRIALYLPFWLHVRAARGRRACCAVPRSGTVRIPYAYRLWVSRPRQSPLRQAAFVDGAQLPLFYGPWLLLHRFASDVPPVSLLLDKHGFATNGHTAFLRGLNLYGETIRISLPSSLVIAPDDVARGLQEDTGTLYLYPLRDHESVWRSSSRVALYHTHAPTL